MLTSSPWPASWPGTPAGSAALRDCSASRRTSMLPPATSWSWPMRFTRAPARSSTAGCHPGSTWATVLAAAKGRRGRIGISGQPAASAGGGASTTIGISCATGLFGGTVELWLGSFTTFTDCDKPALLSALGKFGDNLEQEQVHVRQGTKARAGKKLADGSGATSVHCWKLKAALDRKTVKKSDRQVWPLRPEVQRRIRRSLFRGRRRRQSHKRRV